MSATRRGSTVIADEYYPTPAYAVRALLPVLRRTFIAPPRVILDPGCGEGAVMIALSEAFPRALCIGVELDNERAERAFAAMPDAIIVDGSYLDDAICRRIDQFDPDLVVANPPFSLLREFVERSMFVAPRAPVVVLARLNWIAGARKRDPARSELLKRERPSVHVLEKRPAFSTNKNGKVGTDAADYAWLAFRGQSPGTWEILECE